MSNNRSREELIRILTLAAAGKLTPEDLEEQGLNITLNLDPNWFHTNGVQITPDEMMNLERERYNAAHPGRRKRGIFITLNLS